jgi:8-oxo-dGTP diphosphatase
MSGSTPNIAPEPALPGVPDAMPDYSGYLHVAAAVIEDGAGRILLARRPAHLHQGGLWEFPGGKVEAGEAVSGALARELKEELGIRVTRAAPLIRIPYAYPDRRVLLDVWRVSAYEGAAYGAEGQVVKWVERKRLRDYAFPAANRPIVAAAMLPARYLITPDPGTADTWPAFLSHLQARMGQGIRLVQLRAKQLNGAEYGELARRVIALGREYGTTVMLNTSPAFARELDADGLHLSSRSLRTLQERPLGAERWLAASCHNLAELRHAMAIGVDFAVLSPVKPTTSHPGARALGWDAFHRMTEHSGIPLYALGGMSEADIDTARAQGGQGIAAISSLWRSCG